MQAESLLWASRALMADSPKLFLYRKIIYFSSHTGFERKCGGSFQWASEESLCHPRVCLCTELIWPLRKLHWTLCKVTDFKSKNKCANQWKMLLQEALPLYKHLYMQHSNIWEKKTDIPKFCFIFWSFLPTPMGNRYFQPLNMHVIN